MVLDLELRLHAHALMSWLERQNIEGIIDLTPGIRSLQVHYDHRLLPEEKLLALLTAGQASLARGRRHRDPLAHRQAAVVLG